MNESFNFARFYRNAVRQLCVQFADVDDANFRTYLERQYEREKETLQSLMVSGAPEAQLAPVRNGLFVLAVGLLAFGRLDTVDDILNNIPHSGDIRRLALGLKAMLPLPEDLDPQHNPDEISQWVSANRARLEWVEKTGKFLFR